MICLLITIGIFGCRKDEPKPVPTPEIANRTVLVYMVAANTLGGAEADSADIKEMTRAIINGDLGNNRWVIYQSTYSNSRLYELTKNGMSMLKEYPSGSSVSIERMQSVIDDSRNYAPAEKYGIVFWSHANGWLEDGVDEGISAKPLSFGQDMNNRMNITSLRAAIENYGFDYLYFDCCLMGSVEVCYELSNCAEYIVASPSEIPLDGMPYDQNLKLLCDGSREALIEAATNTFNHYNGKTSIYERSACMSVIDTQQLKGLTNATAAIYALTPILHPLTTVTNYYGSSHTRQAYYLDFGEYVEALCESNSLDPALLVAYNDAMSKAVIYCDATEAMWNEYFIYNNSGLSTRVFIDAEDANIKGYDRLQWFADVVSHHPEFSSNL